MLEGGRIAVDELVELPVPRSSTSLEFQQARERVLASLGVLDTRG